MKTVVVYYSYSGHSKKIAQSLAKSVDADLTEINCISPRTMLGVLTAGIWKARKRRTANIAPIEADLSKYDRIIVIGPVWGGGIAPALYSFIRDYSLNDKLMYFIITYEHDPESALELLRKELLQQNINCKGIVSVCSDKQTLDAFCEGVFSFGFDDEGNIIINKQ